MNLVADESLDRQIVERLRRDGHSVTYVAEMDPGIPDGEVLSLANQRSAVLVTADRDFGELVFRRGSISHGVLLIRMAGLPQERKAELVSSAIRAHTSEIPYAFSVLTPGTIRIRQRP